MNTIKTWTPIGTIIRLDMQRELNSGEWEDFEKFCKRTDWITAWQQGDTNSPCLVVELEDMHVEGVRHKIEVMKQQIAEICASNLAETRVQMMSSLMQGIVEDPGNPVSRLRLLVHRFNDLLAERNEVMAWIKSVRERSHSESLVALDLIDELEEVIG